MPSRGVLSIVQRHFPKVTKVEDAKKNLAIEVTKVDESSSKRRNHEECAMAVACKRAYHADGVIIARSVAYLVKGTLAIRFKIPPSVAREMTSFDRGGPFTPGEYQLSRPAKADTLATKKKRGDNKSPGGHTGPSREIRKYHLTTGIRSVLGSVEDKD
jgi:hypothetical protein